MAVRLIRQPVSMVMKLWKGKTTFEGYKTSKLPNLCSTPSTYCMHVYVCKHFYLLHTVQSIDDDDDPNTSVVSTTKEDGTAKDQTPHQTDKNVEETAPSSSAANEQTNTTSTTDNDSNDDGNV